MHGNNTFADEEGVWLPMSLLLFYIAFVSLSALLSVVFNTFAIYILRKETCGFERTVSWSCILIALNDMAFGVLNVAILVAQIFNKLHLCVAGLYGYWISFATALYLLGVINVDRAIMVLYPLRYNIIATERRTILVLLAITIIPTTFIITLQQTKRLPFREMFTAFCYNSRDAVPDDINRWMSLFWVFSAIPSVAITVANVLILRVALKIAQKDRAMRRVAATVETIRSASNNASSSSPEDIVQVTGESWRGNLKRVRTILLLTIMTYLSWLPGMIGFYKSDSPGWLLMAVNMPAACSCWWNSVIYVITNREYRRVTMDNIRSIIRRTRGTPFR